MNMNPESGLWLPESTRGHTTPDSCPAGHLGAAAINGQVELGPDSLLWRWAGDWRIGLTGLSAGALQLMHPDVSAGVIDHSNFFNEPWERIRRSLPWIIGTIYDPEPSETGRQVRGFHKDIKGTNEHDKRYHALNPETYWWTHATFQWMVEQVVDRYDKHDLSNKEREQMYQEGVVWWERHGLSMKPVPKNYKAFQEKWNYYLDEVLEMTPAAERAIDLANNRNVNKVPYFPSVLWPIGRIPTSEVVRLWSIGGIPQKVRKRLDIPWSLFDEARIKMQEATVRNHWQRVHPKMRYHPRARAGHRHAMRQRELAKDLVYGGYESA